eukprot:TRINITY_DN21741_c0_g3_i1.p1 TRINITY_DN21741_c0_g3~~TRINITY_DN21741_c0_g3_i1.p1  ORF type:complete len:329 (+),score=68.65 TRINITY_DN21741_c0_g3_i1:111-1097(+)
MVQPMIEAKFSEYGLVNSGTGGHTGEKQQPVSVKKLSLQDLQDEIRNKVVKRLGNDKQQPVFVRDLQSEMRNEVAKLLGNSPISNAEGPVVDATKVSGIKRTEPGCMLRPNYCHRSPFSNSTNGHLVYVRRKIEPESGKKKTCENGDKTEFPLTRAFSSKKQKVLGQKNQIQDLKISCSPTSAPTPVASVMAFSRREPSVPQLLDTPGNGLTVAEPQYPMSNTGIPSLVNSHRNYDQHLKDRFLQLQMFLKSCDQSSQEEYIRRLRSLSAVGRSRHAVELEERVICLLLEEGKELHRTKVLNVLEKYAPMKYISTATQPHPVAAFSEK